MPEPNNARYTRSMAEAAARLDAPHMTCAQRGDNPLPFAEGLEAICNLSYLAEHDLPAELTALIHEALAANTSCPRMYAKARCMPDWKEWERAILKELAKMQSYGVWTEVKREAINGLKGKPLSGRWVFTRKIDGVTGKATSDKAWWVVKGHKQRAGINYVELYAGVVHKDTITVDAPAPATPNATNNKPAKRQSSRRAS